MKNPISGLNKDFESRIRLGVMSVLMVNNDINFSALKELLGTSDGNLSSHVTALEKKDYLSVNKTFKGKKPQTTYRITKLGAIAFRTHLQALESIIKNN